MHALQIVGNNQQHCPRGSNELQTSHQLYQSLVQTPTRINKANNMFTIVATTTLTSPVFHLINVSSRAEVVSSAEYDSADIPLS
jgi:hypothetical protein